MSFGEANRKGMAALLGDAVGFNLWAQTANGLSVLSNVKTNALPLLRVFCTFPSTFPPWALAFVHGG